MEDISARNIALLGVVLALFALVLSFVDSAKSGTISTLAGTTKAVMESNDKALLAKIDALNARVSKLEEAAKAPAPARQSAKAKAKGPNKGAEGAENEEAPAPAP